MLKEKIDQIISNIDDAETEAVALFESSPMLCNQCITQLVIKLKEAKMWLKHSKEMLPQEEK